MFLKKACKYNAKIRFTEQNDKHATKEEFVGHDTAENREEIDEHQEVAIDITQPTGIEAKIGT